MSSSSWPVTAAAAETHRQAVVWDQHVCLPMRADAEIKGLLRYVDAGAAVVSVCVGIDWMPRTESIKMISALRQQIANEPRLVLAASAEDVMNAKLNGQTAIIFDLEGTEPLGGEVAMVELFYELGVRTMAFAYNETNRAGGGCHDGDNPGLTAYGRSVLCEMNRVGMVVDGSHCSQRTSLELCEASASPVIFSHSNPRALHDHDRNLTDEQIRACAATSGVIGINGVGILLGNNDAGTERVLRAIGYVAELVGVEHVGLGLDYIFDRAELQDLLKNKSIFPERGGYGAAQDLQLVEPERLPRLTESLMDHGMSSDETAAVMGQNFLRVAYATWR